MAITRVRPTADVVLREAGARYNYELLSQAKIHPDGFDLWSYCDGFGQSRFMRDLAGKGEFMGVGRYRWADPKVATNAFVPTDMVLEEAGGAYMCRPFLDVWQTVRKADWVLSGDSGDWEETDVNVGLDQDYAGNDIMKYEVHMLNSAPGGPPMMAESRFALPPNPCFCISLARCEPHADHAGQAYTAIVFGQRADAGYALVMPFKEPAALYRYRTEHFIKFFEDERGLAVSDFTAARWEKLDDSEQSLQMPSAEGFAKGERALIWIAVIGGRIVISTDAFQKHVNIWDPTDDETEKVKSCSWQRKWIDAEGVEHAGGPRVGPTQVPTAWVQEGGVGVWGRGCEFSFGFFPCRMFEALFRSRLIPALYKTADANGDRSSSMAFVPWMPLDPNKETIYFTRGKIDDPTADPEQLVELLDQSDGDLSPLDEDGNERLGDEAPSWFAQWALTVRPRWDPAKTRDPDSGQIGPGEYNPASSVSKLYFWRSPQVSFVTFAEEGVCAEPDPALGVDASPTEDDAPGFSGDYAQGSEAGRFRLVLDNHLGQHKGLGSRRWFEISPGWVLNNDLLSVGQEYTETQLLFGGYALEPVLGIEGGGRHYMEVPLHDDFLRFGEMIVDSRVPAFDDWTARAAIQWVLARCGIPDAKIDLEDTGYRLPVSTSEWLLRFEKGRRWVDVLFDLCQRDHNAGLWLEDDGTVMTGCRFCRVKRNSDITSEFYRGFHKHYNDSGCLSTDIARNSSGYDHEYYTRGGKATDAETGYGEVVHVERYSEQLPGLEFATHVEVGGKDLRGRPISVVANCEAAVRDPTDARFTGGWPIYDTPRHEEGVITEAEAAEMARLRCMQVCHVNEFVAVTVAFDQRARRGRVFILRGSEDLDLDGVKFRSVGLVYDMDRRILQMPPTTVIGRRLSHENAPQLPG